MKIAVAGSGYVGLSLGVLLSLQNEVTIVDILPSKSLLLIFFPLKLIRLIMAYHQFKMNILNIT